MLESGGEPRHGTARNETATNEGGLSERGRVRCIGRLRVPITLHCAPWATLYRLPDGRLLWCVRLWSDGAPRRRVLGPATLRAYARRSGLVELEAALEELTARAVGARRDRSG